MRMGARVPFTPVYVSGRVPGTRRRSTGGDLGLFGLLLLPLLAFTLGFVVLVWLATKKV